LALDDQKKLAADFIKQQSLAVVSTIWNGAPQAALVVFSERQEFQLIFGTFDTSRKYRNLMKNPKIAAVIGLDQSITVQIEGIAYELKGDELAECRDIHVRKSPASEKYVYLDGERFFKIVPNWLRYTDISTDPDFVFEFEI
jgi:uncharacterized protein YhbP (UPF0306 family)